MDDQLELLIADGVIDEVLGRLKSGKEANISLVRRGDVVMAAKVYKDRATRSFKNNADYKEGRKVRNSRTQRAMDSGGKFGRDAAEQAWKSAEADAMFKLVGSGVRSPTPIMFYEGVLLMDLVRDAEGHPAPRLIDVAFEREAAVSLYADLVAQIISMLCCDLIHGDLSPYNILAAADGPTIIDFPQVLSAVHSSRAEYFFLRDFDNVVGFVSGFDPSLAPHTADGRAIWRAYVSRDLTPEFVPPPPPPPRPTRGPDRRSRPDDRDRPQRDHRGPPQRDHRGRPPAPADNRPAYSADPPRPPQPPPPPPPPRPAYDGNARGPSQPRDYRGPLPPRPAHNNGDSRGPSQQRTNDRPAYNNGDSRGPSQQRDSRGPQPPRTDNRSASNRGDSRGPAQPRTDGRGPQPPRTNERPAFNNGDSRGPSQQRDHRGPPPPRTDTRPASNNGDARGPSQQRDNRGPSQPRPDGRGAQPQRSDGRGPPPQRSDGSGPPAPPRSDLRSAPPPRSAPPRFDRPPAPPRPDAGGGGERDRPRNARRRPRRRG